MKIVLLVNNDIYCVSVCRKIVSYFTDCRISIIASNDGGRSKFLPSNISEMQSYEKCIVDEKATSYDDINSDEAFADLKNFAPDLMISIRFGQIFRRSDLIALPRFGIINLHSGILPNYRGILASFWAILAGEKKLGMTLHYIVDSGIDTGPIIDSFRQEIDWGLSLSENISRLYPRGCEMILRTVKKIFAGEEIEKIDQKTLGKGRYFSYPKEEDVVKFPQEMRLF